jgi:hypothetical protein
MRRFAIENSTVINCIDFPVDRTAVVLATASVSTTARRAEQEHAAELKHWLAG